MKRLLLLFTLSVLPLSVSPSGSPEQATIFQEAQCGDGSCCPYENAVCGLNGKNYENKEYVPGPCSPIIIIE